MLQALMKNRLVLLLTLPISVYFSGCASRKVAAPAQKAPSVQKQSPQKVAESCSETRKTNNVKEGDIDRDGRVDIFRYYKEIDDPERKGERKVILVRQDLDLNWDGRLDICRFFNDKGKVDREEFDLDYDGKIDEVKIYHDGVIQSSQRDRNNDGRFDVTRRYKDGKLVEKETDTNDDGKPDRWEYYDGNKLDRIGTDTNYDGKVDSWAKSSL